MTKADRDIQRKLKVLRHAEKTGHVARTCRYFGVGRSSFYRWKAAYDQFGEAGLVNAKPIPKNPANRTPPEIVDKVLYLRSKYHLGSIRIVWYLARYHGITISDAGVTRVALEPRSIDAMMAATHAITGVDFREAHEIIARVVNQAIAEHKMADKIDLDLIQAAAQAQLGQKLTLSPQAVRDAIDPTHSEARRKGFGGPESTSVSSMITTPRTEIAGDQQTLLDRKHKLEVASASLDATIDALNKG